MVCIKTRTHTSKMSWVDVCHLPTPPHAHQAILPLFLSPSLSALAESELKLNFDYKIKQETISVRVHAHTHNGSNGINGRDACNVGTH